MLFVLAGLTLASLAFAAATLILCLRFIAGERTHAASERAVHAQQIGDLMQRIQAPEVAVMTHATQYAEPVAPPVAMDDDAAVWESMGVDAPSKEQLAELAFAERLA